MTEGAPSPDFTEWVKLRAFDDKYIDKIEERDILQHGLGLGMTVDQARAALINTCQTNGYILESEIFRGFLENLESFVKRDGALSRHAFQEACALGKRLVGNVKGEIAVRRMLCRLIDDHGLPIRKGWFSNWYASMKRELGLV